MPEKLISIVGQKIKQVRMMTDKEMENNMWDGEKSAVIVLENGVKLYASCDYEGNGAGAIWGESGKTCFTLYID